MDANEDTGEDAAAQQERRRVRVNRLLLLHIFQSTVQHVVTIQSEMLLFLRACDGDAASATRVKTREVTLLNLGFTLVATFVKQLHPQWIKYSVYTCESL